MKDVGIQQVFLLDNCEKFKNKKDIKEWADYVSSERLKLGIKVPEIDITKLKRTHIIENSL